MAGVPVPLSLPPDDRTRIEALFDGRLVGAEEVRGGYTPAERWILSFSDGTSLFAKVGATPDTARWLRREQHVYTHLHAPCLPVHRGWVPGERPILLLEDLSAATWPPPWNASRVDAVRSSLELIHRQQVPELPTLEAAFREAGPGWEEVARDPEPFLSLGLVDGDWLAPALPRLIAAESEADPRGDALLHFDLRSDNLCLRTPPGGGPSKALIFDWNLACCGNPELDLAFWLPSLHAEGGPRPDELLPAHPSAAAWVSGFFAARAGLPVIPQAPRVREVQLQQLRSALPWAQRALGLPAPA